MNGHLDYFNFKVLKNKTVLRVLTVLCKERKAFKIPDFGSDSGSQVDVSLLLYFLES